MENEFLYEKLYFYMENEFLYENYIIYRSTLKRYIANYKPYVPQTSELLKVIELDIRIDNICLKDRFEWDINDPKNNPEVFIL